MRIVVFLTILATTINYIYAQHTENRALEDVTAYCKYLNEKKGAQITALRYPDAVVFLNNINNANGGANFNDFQKVAIAGLSKNLFDYNEANLLNQLIQDECAYYKLNQEAKLQIQYVISALKIKALKYKLQQIEDATKKLNSLLSTINQRVLKHNDTLHSFYEVDSSLKKLEDAERQIDLEIASQSVPQITFANLSQLLRQVITAKVKRQKTLNELEKNNNISIQIQAGAQQNLSYQQNQNTQPYFSLNFRYNLGSILSNQKLDKSLISYADWQKKRVEGTQTKLLTLMTTIKSLKVAEENRLNHLKKNYMMYFNLSQKVDKIKTPKATRFKQRLDVDQMLMKIEINYMKYTVALLNKILGSV